MVCRVSCHRRSSRWPSTWYSLHRGDLRRKNTARQRSRGGIPRSIDGGVTWRPTIDIESDVHEVRAHPTRPDIVIAAAAIGLYISRDAGESWSVEREGLHTTYCSAVAFSGNDMLSPPRWITSRMKEQSIGDRLTGMPAGIAWCRTPDTDRWDCRYGLHCQLCLNCREGHFQTPLCRPQPKLLKRKHDVSQ